MRKVATLIAGLLASTGVASATPIIQFAQTSNSNTITGTENAADTQTTISGSGVQVDIAQDIGGFLGNALFSINATSTDAAVPAGGGAIQHYDGTFSITSGSTNILSGTFTDAALGVGSALTLTIGSPPDVLDLTSSLIPISDLLSPDGASFSLTNVLPPIGILGMSIESFTATLSGNVSATEAVGEPATLGLFTASVLFLGMLAKAKPRKPVVKFDCI